MEQRQSKYLRTLGEQFSFLVNKITEITFISKLFGILMDALMEILKNYIFYTLLSIIQSNIFSFIVYILLNTIKSITKIITKHIRYIKIPAK